MEIKQLKADSAILKHDSAQRYVTTLAERNKSMLAVADPKCNVAIIRTGNISCFAESSS